MQKWMDGEVPSWIHTRLAHWRAGVLGATVLACGLVLNLAVLGANPAAKLLVSSPAPVADPPLVTETLPPTTAAPVPEVAEFPLVALDGEAADSIGGSNPVAAPAVNAAIVPPAPQQTATAPKAPSAASSTSTAAPAGAPTTVAPTTAAPTTSPSTVAPTTVAPATTSPTTTPATTAVPNTAGPQIEYPGYTVEGGVGDVVLKREGDAISLYGFYPNSGWVHEVDKNGPNTVKLKFFNVQTEKDSEWKATVNDGRIQVEN